MAAHAGGTLTLNACQLPDVDCRRRDRSVAEMCSESCNRIIGTTIAARVTAGPVGRAPYSNY